MDLINITCVAACALCLVACIRTQIQLNKLLDLTKKQTKRFYELVNMCRDENRDTHKRIEHFEKTLTVVVQNLAKSPIYYNTLYAASNGLKEFTYEELSKLYTEYDAWEQSKKGGKDE